MAAWKTTQIHEIDEITDGRVPWRPVRFHFGIESFGINVFNGKAAGDRLINEHDEVDDEQEELYFVHSGRARFELDGETLDAGPGTFVYAEPGVKRTAFAEEPNTNLIALGGVPGKAYETHGWEIWAPLQPLYQAGEYEQVADRGRELVSEHPTYAHLAYNVACCESLAGRTQDAIEHLRLALAKAADLRRLAAEDSDLDPLRGEPAFRELMG